MRRFTLCEEQVHWRLRDCPGFNLHGVRYLRRAELPFPLPNPPPRSLRSLGREFWFLESWTVSSFQALYDPQHARGEYGPRIVIDQAEPVAVVRRAQIVPHAVRNLVLFQ